MSPEYSGQEPGFPSAQNAFTGSVSGNTEQFKNTSCLRMKFNKRIRRSKSFVSTVVSHMYKMCLSYSFSVKESAHSHSESERQSIHLNELDGRPCSGRRRSKSWLEGHFVLVESRKYSRHLRGIKCPPKPQNILKIIF